MTATAGPGRTRFSDEDLDRLMGLIQDADSVELKVTVPESRQSSTVAALGIDPLDAQLRQAFFFDTPDLALDRTGIVVRARRTQHRADDTVVKLRPVVPSDLPGDLRSSANFWVEVDALPGSYVCSGSLRGASHAVDVRAVVSGGQPVHRLFTKGQRQLYAERAPAGVELDDLSVLGPILVLKVKFTPVELGLRLVGEMWLYPDGSRILELSTKCAPDRAFQVAAELRAHLTRHHVDLSGEQQTKTRKALEFFGSRLAN